MIGETAGNFILKDQYGKEFELYRNLDKNILLIFYPKDNSRVCSRQLHNYQENSRLFNDKNISPVGINIDNVDSHKKFCDEIGIEFPLLFDEDKSVSRNYGALNLFGINKRKLVLISSDRKIIFEENVSYLNYPAAEQLVGKFEYLNI